MKVAIDGPAGSGKSTIAKILAHRYDFTLIDTGAMYRSVTLIALREGADVNDEAQMAEIARRIRISFYPSDEGQMVFIDGENVTEAIRTADIDANVSAVSAFPAVRQALVEAQRQMGEEGDVVAEGRDIGTVVFPDAEVKVFLTADPQARAHRRALQRDVSDPDQEMEILKDLVRRDDADSSREMSPLRAADDAYVMDSTSMSIEEEVAKISQLIEEAKPGITPVVDGPFENQDRFEESATAEPQALAHDEAPQKEAPFEEAPTKKKKSKKGKDKGKGKGKSKDKAEAPAPAEDAEPAQEAVEDEAPQAKRTSKRAPKEKKEDAKDEKMRPFKRHPDEDYYDHGIDDYPVGAKLVLMTAVGVCGGLSKVLWPWSVENGKALWKADGGRVVIMNHESMMDPVIVVCSDYFHGRKMRPIYKSELDEVPVLKWLLARVGGIPVARGKADIKCVRRAQRALQRGEDVLVFPEGTRILSDDQEIEIHAGFALMAQLAKAPVLPMAIVGARDGGIGGNKPIRPGRVYMAVGDPITFDEIEAKGRKQQASEMEERAMKAVYSLRDRLRAKHPGKM